MAKKKAEEKINIDSILFKCRDILRAARNSGSFFEKRDMMLTLVFLIILRATGLVMSVTPFKNYNMIIL